MQKNLGRNHPLARGAIDSAVVDIWTAYARCLAHLKHPLFWPPLTQHYQLGLRPDLGLHFFVLYFFIIAKCMPSELLLIAASD
jgi:hypothetical protein